MCVLISTVQLAVRGVAVTSEGAVLMFVLVCRVGAMDELLRENAISQVVEPHARDHRSHREGADDERLAVCDERIHAAIPPHEPKVGEGEGEEGGDLREHLSAHGVDGACLPIDDGVASPAAIGRSRRKGAACDAQIERTRPLALALDAGAACSRRERLA